MESKEYFEKVMQDYNQNGKGHNLRKYYKDEALGTRRTIHRQKKDSEEPRDSFIPVIIKEDAPASKT